MGHLKPVQTNIWRVFIKAELVTTAFCKEVKSEARLVPESVFD